DGSGYLEQGLAFARMEFRNLRIRCNFVTARLADWLTAPQIIAGRECRTRRRIHRAIKREHPAPTMRFERNPLPNRLATRRTLAGSGKCRRASWRFPFETFAVPHYDAAPIHRAESGDFPIGKLGAESYVRR